ncbi:MAG TPA: TylF/MycF/NovP-related O-methyltransferase [Tepidisphaeraceae bacterium]|nr:TylF/MycF/NovP-related O-methyltransferase [Tepidisphaeraceae bacterium]
MFYWLDDEKAAKLRTALDTLREIYPNRVYAADMIIAMGKSLGFLSEPQFRKSFFSTVRSEQEKSLAWRVHVLAWAAGQAMNVPGDFVECGVFQGFCSAVLCKYLDFARVQRTYFLYDTFSGLPEETSTEQERETWNRAYRELDMSNLEQRVRDTFSAYPNVRIVPGVVPQSFEIACPDKIAFLHIDMNSAKAEILALEHLFDRVSPGGFIVFDDYGWIGNKPQAEAEAAFLKERGHSILELPTGQGVVMKNR